MSEFPEGWIAHYGGPCPVDPQERPGIIYRHKSGGSIATATIPPGMFPAKVWVKAPASWENGIVAYKPA